MPSISTPQRRRNTLPIIASSYPTGIFVNLSTTGKKDSPGSAEEVEPHNPLTNLNGKEGTDSISSLLKIATATEPADIGKLNLLEDLNVNKHGFRIRRLGFASPPGHTVDSLRSLAGWGSRPSGEFVPGRGSPQFGRCFVEFLAHLEESNQTTSRACCDHRRSSNGAGLAGLDDLPLQFL